MPQTHMHPQAFLKLYFPFSIFIHIPEFSFINLQLDWTYPKAA